MRKSGRVVWNELNTRDLDAAEKFYGPLFGWAFERMAQGESEYGMAIQDGEYVAGIFDMNTLPMLDGVPSHWFTYFAVDDLDASVENIVASGGSVRRAPFEVGGNMRVAIIVDATGAVIGLNEATEG